MKPVPTELTTTRLRLTCWQADDAAALRALLDRCDAHLRPWIPFMQHEPRTLDQTREGLASCRASFAANEHYRFAIRELATDAIIGETVMLLVFTCYPANQTPTP